MKEKSGTRRMIRAVGAAALLAVAVWSISLIAESFGFMPFASYEKRAARFAARCAPQWETAKLSAERACLTRSKGSLGSTGR